MERITERDLKHSEVPTYREAHNMWEVDGAEDAEADGIGVWEGWTIWRSGSGVIIIEPDGETRTWPDHDTYYWMPIPATWMGMD